MALAVEPGRIGVGKGRRASTFRRVFLGRRGTIAATGVIAGFAAAALLAPVLAPYDPLAQSYLRINAYPSASTGSAPTSSVETSSRASSSGRATR
jgi:peptide/nickel transport system permease protein